MGSTDSFFTISFDLLNPSLALVMADVLLFIEKRQIFHIMWLQFEKYQKTGSMTSLSMTFISVLKFDKAETWAFLRLLELSANSDQKCLFLKIIFLSYFEKKKYICGWFYMFVIVHRYDAPIDAKTEYIMLRTVKPQLTTTCL